MTVDNQYTKKYRNFPPYLRAINIDNLVKSIHLSIYFMHIKYQGFISKGI